MTPDDLLLMASACDGRKITADYKTGALLRALREVWNAALELQATKRMKDEIAGQRYAHAPPPPGKVAEYRCRRKEAWLRNDIALARLQELSSQP